MRILITGANGQLGWELQRALSTHDLILADQPEFELTDPHVTRKIISLQPEVCVHAAAYTDVDGCEREPQRAVHVNADGAARVADAAAQVGAYLVYVSTDYVFDGKKTEPYTETDVPNPVNAYGRSKLLGEQAVLSRCPGSLIIRTSWLYGRHGRNFVKTILDLARSRGELRVVSDQYGSPTYARELAGVIAQLVQQRHHGVLHTGGAGSCSWYEFAAAILEEAKIPCRNIPISTAESDRLAKRPPYSVLSSARLNSYGLALSGWQEALKDFMNEYLPALSAANQAKPIGDT
jgi:dTDP-4-dehydrorhamnose reductase